jgi:RNA-directed DNA polymerase
MGQCQLIRYADDFVVMARHMGPKIQDFIEQKLEAWLGLKLNRDKTRIVNLRRPEERLEFLGYQVGLAPVRTDRCRHYWRMEPSDKAMEREVDRIWEMTSCKQGWKPLPELIGELNRHLKGWTNYYRLGQPRKAFQRLNRYVRQRLYQRLRRSSQRPWKPAPGQSAYGYLKELGLIYL